MTNLDILGTLVQFVPETQFMFFATVSRGWRSVWGQRRKVTSYVTEHSSPSLLRYSFENGLPQDEVGVCSAIARLGKLELLKYAREEGCPWDEQTCLEAAKGGFVEVLKYAYESKCRTHPYACEFAAEGGHREVIEWSQQDGRKYSFKLSYWTCAVAAGAGQLELLLWLRTNECSWNWRTVDLARKGGHMDIVQWAQDNGVPSRPSDTESDTEPDPELDIPPHRRESTKDEPNPTPMVGPKIGRYYSWVTSSVPSWWEGSEK